MILQVKNGTQHIRNTPVEEKKEFDQLKANTKFVSSLTRSQHATTLTQFNECDFGEIGKP
jgi:hypothetical protein